jgi:hypothetical protein
MASTIILAVFIGTAATFDAGIAGQGAFRQATFPNSFQGIQQLGKWIESSGVRDFDQVCVSGPPMDPSPATRFWATRKVPVFIIDFGQVRHYMKVHNVPTASAAVVARTCLSLLPRK